MLPEKIRDLIGGEAYQPDDVGMSGSSVLLFRDRVLKIQEDSAEAENECCMLRYLQGKLPVPELLFCEKLEGRVYLMMSRCRGRMACDEAYMRDPGTQCRLLAEGLRRLWSVDISDRPSDQRLAHKLEQARYNVDNGLVDLDNVEPDTFGEKGFKDPQALLRWLYDNMPEEEPVLSHGDYCLPNIFGLDGEVSGYIDLGRAGIADKWCDIALCCRSLSHNYSGKYHGAACSGHDEMMLFEELGIEPDREKLRYYILLDELF